MSGQIKPAIKAINHYKHNAAQASLWLYTGLDGDGTIARPPHLEVVVFAPGVSQATAGINLAPEDAQALRDLADTLDAIFALHKKTNDVASA